MPITVKGVAFSDILTYVLTRGDADSLASLDCQHYHGLIKGSPVGREHPYSKPHEQEDVETQNFASPSVRLFNSLH